MNIEDIKLTTEQEYVAGKGVPYSITTANHWAKGAVVHIQSRAPKMSTGHVNTWCGLGIHCIHLEEHQHPSEANPRLELIKLVKLGRTLQASIPSEQSSARHAIMVNTIKEMKGDQTEMWADAIWALVNGEDTKTWF